jgi:hypothetical protein
MKAETNIKALAFDWVFKGLIAVVCFLVKDIREDVKQLMQTVPALQAKVDILNDQRLIDKFRAFQPPPMKPEEEITYDSLNHKR